MSWFSIVSKLLRELLIRCSGELFFIYLMNVLVMLDVGMVDMFLVVLCRVLCRMLCWWVIFFGVKFCFCVCLSFCFSRVSVGVMFFGELVMESEIW